MTWRGFVDVVQVLAVSAVLVFLAFLLAFGLEALK